MATSTAFKAAIVAQIEYIDDDLDKAEATYLCDRYFEALDKQQALEANEITSYSIAGRTFTRRTAAEGQSVINQLRHELDGFLYGTAHLVDANTETAEPTGL